MKKRFAAVFAATAILGVTTAFAANPFSDVTPDTWAYQSVSQLANAGIINGYPDGTFKGQTNITRYEMAQMVAKAMANQDRANAEQQAMINRLADEFSTELNNLGVRVSNLENKVGNVKVTGDVRLRYKQTEHKDSKFDYRGRIKFNAMVNDNTTATVRVGASNNFGSGDADHTDFAATVDQAYVAHNFSKELTAVVGRQNLFVGGGLMYDDAFDGAALAYDNGKVSATVGYGTPIAGLGNQEVKDTATVTLAQANVKLADNVSVGGFYVRGNKDIYTMNDNGKKTVKTNKAVVPADKDTSSTTNVYGFNTDMNFGNVWVGGEWLKANYDNSNAWVAGIGYGNYDQAVAGTWDVKAQYMYANVAAPILSNTYSFQDAPFKGWLATVDYAVAKNVGVTAYYGFANKSVDTDAAKDNQKQADYYQAQLNFKF
ncbi:hypothetical protein HMPREF0872_05535 [Veillonella montpellierensis DNF00314]|uniref:SLH domain-containing protein n=1 Tax=Veillonella montpellierensis DNF00314 TaxID=1401067 RepID=A0A096CP85_9FIRM|nr:S-layer homology domain-containing protein [Veillonella montpellierensis]KGF47139.1 hypothetical protein HMPREF0872_05535 [Veillonella montpellierensis DNF00314]